MHVLGNGWEQIEVRGEPLVAIGQEWPWFRPAPDLSACPPGPFRLCLSHTPDNIRWARRAGVDLMLSGHVHGGQVRLPVFGSMLVPSRYGRRYDCGVFDEDADAAARQPRPRRRPPAAVPVPPGGDAADLAAACERQFGW